MIPGGRTPWGSASGPLPPDAQPPREGGVSKGGEAAVSPHPEQGERLKLYQAASPPPITAFLPSTIPQFPYFASKWYMMPSSTSLVSPGDTGEV